MDAIMAEISVRGKGGGDHGRSCDPPRQGATGNEVFVQPAPARLLKASPMPRAMAK